MKDATVGQSFFAWWLGVMPRAILRYAGRTRATVDDVFAVKAMVQHLNEPIFQDPTWQGKIIGIVIRLLRIGIGLVVEGIVFGIGLAVVVLWYALPLIALWGII